MNNYKPNTVYHAAAYKHVPLMELFPWEAVQTNVFGTVNIVNLAIKYRSEKFVFISSDKAVNPTSIMGATKRLSEIIVQGQSSNQNKTSFVVLFQTSSTFLRCINKSRMPNNHNTSTK